MLDPGQMYFNNFAQPKTVGAMNIEPNNAYLGTLLQSYVSENRRVKRAMFKD